MALFEIFIPSSTSDGLNITARIRAESWISALRNGLAKLGDSADVRNVMCDITEQGIDVTEPNSGRVFRIRELPESSAASSPAQGTGGTPPPPAPITPRPQPLTATPATTLSTGGPAAARVGAPAAEPPTVAGPPPPAPKDLSGRAPRARAVASLPPPRAGGRRLTWAPPPPTAELLNPLSAGARPRFHTQVETETVTTEQAASPEALSIGRHEEASGSVEDLLAELVCETQNIYKQQDLVGAAGFVLDLAMRTVPSESGAVFLADINRNDLSFATARGPKADEVMGFRVPMGVGIVGFCAQEGVSLAVSDVHRDPRFYATISKKIGYETKSILCAPSQKEGRVFGALELINKRQGTSFTNNEVTILNFLAHEFAEYLVNTGQTGE